MHSMTYQTTTVAATAHNGPICTVCALRYVGVHTCSVEDLLRRADELREQAVRLEEKALSRLGPQPTASPDRLAGCPCRTENGGSGVCGCTLSGPEVTC
jgi:hypothetical protein